MQDPRAMDFELDSLNHAPVSDLVSPYTRNAAASPGSSVPFAASLMHTQPAQHLSYGLHINASWNARGQLRGTVSTSSGQAPPQNAPPGGVGQRGQR